MKPLPKGKYIGRVEATDDGFFLWIERKDKPMTLTFLDIEVKKPEKTTLVRIKINDQGYDSGGCYFGVGDPLYWYAMPDGKAYINGHVRAKDREAAKAAVRELHRLRRVEFYV